MNGLTLYVVYAIVFMLVYNIVYAASGVELLGVFAGLIGGLIVTLLFVEKGDNNKH